MSVIQPVASPSKTTTAENESDKYMIPTQPVAITEEEERPRKKAKKEEVITRYTADNLPVELKKCQSIQKSPVATATPREREREAKTNQQTGDSDTSCSASTTKASRWTSRVGTLSRPKRSPSKSQSAVRPVLVHFGR